jgi:CRISPR/Cas system-associated exonuclease Cas4 (RecB family)
MKENVLVGVLLHEIFIHFLDAFKRLKYSMRAVICPYAFEDIITINVCWNELLFLISLFFCLITQRQTFLTLDSCSSCSQPILEY